MLYKYLSLIISLNMLDVKVNNLIQTAVIIASYITQYKQTLLYLIFIPVNSNGQK